MAEIFDSTEKSPAVIDDQETYHMEESPAATYAAMPNPIDSPEQVAASEDVGMINIGTKGSLDAFEEGYERARQSGNAKGTRNALSNSILNNDMFEIQEQTRQFIMESAETEQDMLDAIEASTQLSANIEARMSSPVKGERAAMRAVSDGGVTTSELDMAAVDRKITEDLKSIDDDTGWTDYAWTFGRQFLTLGTITLFDSAGLVGVENMLDTQENLQGQALQFQTIEDPAVKLAAWEQLKVRAFDELPQAEALAYLEQMALASGTVGFEEFNDAAIMWSAVDAGGLVHATAKGLAAGARSLPRAAKTMGNKTLAGEANAKALESSAEETAKRMGMSGKREAADNAHPIPAPDKAGDTSMSLETQQVLQAHREEMNTTVRNIIDGKTTYIETGMHPGEAQKGLAKVRARAARFVESVKGDVQQAAMKENPDGSISVTVALVPKGYAAIPTSKELAREGNRLARLVSDGFISQIEANTLAKMAKERGSSIDSLRNAITDLEEGVDVSTAAEALDTQRAQGFVRTFRASLDDTTGTYSQDRLPIGDWARSNRAAATTPDTIRDYEAAARLDNISAKVAKELSSEVEKIFKELPLVGNKEIPVGRRKAKLRIQKALIDGDEWVDPTTGEEVGKVWSQSELMTKYGLSEKEAKAYYKLRNVYDSLYKIRDAAVRQELVSRGFADIKFRKPIKVLNEETGQVEDLVIHEVGRPIDDSPAVARSQLDQDGVNMVLNSTTSKIDPVPDLDDVYRKGGRIVQFHEPVNIPGQGRVRYALVDSLHEVRDLPLHGVTQYKAGYVPRIYDRGVWFVKEVAPYARVDGRRVDTPLTIGTRGMTDNEADAKALLARLSQQASDEGKSGVSFEIRADNQVDPLEMALSGATGSGGRLYTSSRKGTPIPFYKTEGGQLVEEAASRIDAFEALQSNINNIAFHYPRNEWRIASTLRLQGTAKRLGVQWNGLHQEPMGGTTQARAFINRKRTELAQWLALPDSWETRWGDTMQTLYEKSLGVKIGETSVDNMLLKVPSRGLWWLKSNDPVTALRSSTFHLLLGWFNPAQWFVQAQGFAPAFAQAARFGGFDGVVKVWKLQHTLRAIEHGVNSKTIEGMTKALVKAGISDAEEARKVMALQEIWSKSGLREGVLTTGDFKNASNAMGQGYGALADFANNKGLWFYRQGELFSRRFSLTAAFEEFVRKNPEALQKGLTDAQQKAIVSKANDYMLNLGKANKAAWQRGVLSVPTQFWQVQAKLLEQYTTFGAGKVLTNKEKLALALGQVGLYGAAGVPMLGAYASYYADSEMNPDGVANRTIDEGLYGLVMSIFGADVEVAQRGAILADVQGLMYDFIGGDKTLGELMLGAGNTTIGRIGEAIQRMQPLALTTFDQELPLSQEDFVLAMDAIGDMSTTWSNATKALLMDHSGIIYSRTGKALSMDQYNFQTLLFTALGFTPRQEGQAYALGSYERMLSTAKTDIKKSVKGYMFDMVRAHEVTGNPITEKEAQKFRAVVGYLTSHLQPDESAAMIEEIQEEIMLGKTEFAKATQAYVRISGEMMVDDMLSWFDKTVVGQQAIQEEAIR